MSDYIDLSVKFIMRHPEDAAKLLENLPPAVVSNLLANLDTLVAIKLVKNLPADFAATCITIMPVEQKVDLIQQLDVQSCLEIFRYLHADEEKLLLPKLPLSKRLTIQTLNKYSENSVGSWMNTNITSISQVRSVEEAIEVVQDSSFGYHDHLYMVDIRKNYVATLLVSQLIKAKPNLKISDLEHSVKFSLSARLPLQSVVNHDGWKYFSILPVIEHNGRLVGELSNKTLMDALAKTEDEAATNSYATINETFNLYWVLFNNFILVLNMLQEVLTSQFKPRK